MKKLSLFIIAFLLINGTLINAQDQLKKFGYKGGFLTFSQGRFNESFHNDTIVQVGSVMFNTITHKVVGFVEEDTSALANQSNQSSRWLSPDIHAEKYYNWSPYVYGNNNPVKFIDIDGKDAVILIAAAGAGGTGHMGAVIQDGEGNCYYVTAGNADPNATVSQMASGGTQGGMIVKSLGTKDINEAVTLAKQDDGNSPYTDQVQLNTSSDMDAAIYGNATAESDKVNSGEQKYNLLTGNCADIVKDPINKATNGALPAKVDPRPNKYFSKLKNNQANIQKKIDKQVKKQEAAKQKAAEEEKKKQESQNNSQTETQN